MNRKFYSLLVVASGVLLSNAAQAQLSERAVAEPRLAVQKPFSPSAAELTRAMSRRLKLNEGQYVQLYEVNKTRLSEAAQIEQQYRNDPSAQSAKLQELDAQYQQECGRILTPSQLSQLHEDKPAQPDTTPAGTGSGLG